MSTETSLQGALTAAEAELDELAQQARAAYRRWRDADARQTAKAAHVGDLKQQIREAGGR